jgi:hypothetical protein
MTCCCVRAGVRLAPTCTTLDSMQLPAKDRPSGHQIMLTHNGHVTLVRHGAGCRRTRLLFTPCTKFHNTYTHEPQQAPRHGGNTAKKGVTHGHDGTALALTMSASKCSVTRDHVMEAATVLTSAIWHVWAVLPCPARRYAHMQSCPNQPHRNTSHAQSHMNTLPSMSHDCMAHISTKFMVHDQMYLHVDWYPHYATTCGSGASVAPRSILGLPTPFLHDLPQPARHTFKQVLQHSP